MIWKVRKPSAALDGGADRSSKHIQKRISHHNEQQPPEVGSLPLVVAGNEPQLAAIKKRLAQVKCGRGQFVIADRSGPRIGAGLAGRQSNRAASTGKPPSLKARMSCQDAGSIAFDKDVQRKYRGDSDVGHVNKLTDPHIDGNARDHVCLCLVITVLGHDVLKHGSERVSRC